MQQAGLPHVDTLLILLIWSALMDRGIDIAVYSPDGQLQLVVEAKSQQQTSREWAARFRRNLLVHDVIPPANYFLLAMPDHLYLWKDGVNLAEAPPTYEIP